MVDNIGRNAPRPPKNSGKTALNGNGKHHDQPILNDDSLPPYNIKAETGSLGSMLLNNDNIPKISAFLRPEDFFRDKHATIYRAILDVFGRLGTVDFLLLHDELERKGQFVKVGGREILEEIEKATDNAANGEHYADIVRQLAVKRDSIEILSRAVREARSNTINPQEILDLAQNGIKALHERLAPKPQEEPSKPFRLHLLDAEMLANGDYRPEWFIKKVFARNQPCVVGASKKMLKTTLMVEVAVSLASGISFLGEFEVIRPVNVLLLSGESGGAAIQDIARRVCRSKGITLESLRDRLTISFDLPKLSVPEHQAALDFAIRQKKAEVVILDPLYLSLLPGSHEGRIVDAANVYQMGSLLMEFGKLCLDAGATPILVHHNKLTVSDPFAFPTLENLAFAGIQEYARQWILLGRRERFEPGSGIHKLWLNLGGSIGHSSGWSLDIDEGQMNDDFTGRTWEVEVKPVSEAIAEQKLVKQAEKREAATQKEIDKQAMHRKHEDQIMDSIAKLEGQKGTQKEICALAHLSPANGSDAIIRLIHAGRLVHTTVKIKKGRGFTDGPGFGIPIPGQTGTNRDNA